MTVLTHKKQFLREQRRSLGALAQLPAAERDWIVAQLTHEQRTALALTLAEAPEAQCVSTVAHRSTTVPRRGVEDISIAAYLHGLDGALAARVLASLPPEQARAGLRRLSWLHRAALRRWAHDVDMTGRARDTLRVIADGFRTEGRTSLPLPAAVLPQPPEVP